MFPMYFSLHLIIYLENPAGTLIFGRREYHATKSHPTFQHGTAPVTDNKFGKA
jgi:hypothetical protein